MSLCRTRGSVELGLIGRSASQLYKYFSPSGFTASTLFYVWASMHSYRFLESNIGHGFYIPKVILLALYVAGKIGILYRKNHMIFTSELPLANLTGMIYLYYSANDWSNELGISWAIAITVAVVIFTGLHSLRASTHKVVAAERRLSRSIARNRLDSASSCTPISSCTPFTSQRTLFSS